MDKLNNITQMIDSYTGQIERYESLSTCCAVFTVICILTVLIFAGYLIVKNNGTSNCNGTEYNLILSGLFLTIPSITTLYLYIFDMNMRKVALFRDYLKFLEIQWNTMADSKVMLFDSQIIDSFFHRRYFGLTDWGP